MISVYVNYPVPHFTIHRHPSCRSIQMHRVETQRYQTVDQESLGSFLAEFIERRIAFAAQRYLNDMWIQIELDTPDQELGLVHVVQALIGQRYKPLATAPIEVHCSSGAQQ
jgi:hypothetical protein